MSGQSLHEVIADFSSNPGVRDPAPRRAGGAAARGCRRQGPPALHGAAGAPPAPSAARRRYLAGGGAPRGSSGLATFPRAPSARSRERLCQRSGQLVTATGAGGWGAQSAAQPPGGWEGDSPAPAFGSHLRQLRTLLQILLTCQLPAPEGDARTLPQQYEHAGGRWHQEPRPGPACCQGSTTAGSSPQQRGAAPSSSPSSTCTPAAPLGSHTEGVG